MNARSLYVSDSVAVLTIDDSNSKVNLLSRAMLADLELSFHELAQRTDLHGLILESGKPGIFIAGADLKELAAAPSPDYPPTRAYIEYGLRVFELLESLPLPTVASVDGAALGGGLELALACDYRIVGTNPKTKFGAPEVKLGLIPGWGGTQRLPRIVGPELAIQIMMCGVELDAQTAVDRGLASSVVPSEYLRSAATALLHPSWADDSWKAVRAKKQQPIPMATGDDPVVELKPAEFSEAAVNASAIGPLAMANHRWYVESQMGESLCRPASLALLDVLEKGLPMPLAVAILLETAAFMKLSGSAESKELIAGFFASRKK